MQLKAGTRLRSATDACEVVVVKAPAEPVDLRCGGHPFLPADAEATAESIEAGFDQAAPSWASATATRSSASRSCAPRPAKDAISVGETVLDVKGAKPLPASD